MINFIMNGTYHKAIAKVFKSNQLSTLNSRHNWRNCGRPLRGNVNQGELAGIFSNTIQAIKDNLNGPLDYFKWRASATDTNPLTSDNWNYHRSDFQLDLEGDMPIVDQILDHQAEWGRKHRLS